MDLLSRPDPAVRKTVVGGLVRIPWTTGFGRTTRIAKTLESRLQAMACDPDLGVRIALTNQLVALRSDSEGTIAAIRTLARDPNPGVRIAVIRALGQSGAIREPLRPAYLRLLEDEDPGVRIEAATYIPHGELTRRAFIDVLLKMLKDPSARIRVATALKLSQADYRQQFWDAESRLSNRHYTSAALLQSPTALAVLKSAVNDSDPDVRASSVKLLNLWPGEAATLIPIVIERLKEPSANVRAEAALTLASFGPASEGATRTLLASLADPGTTDAQAAMQIAIASARALEAIGGVAKAKMFRMLLAQINSLDELTRNRAVGAIHNLGDAVRREVLQTFADPRTTRRVQIELLGTLFGYVGREPGPEFQAMAPILRTLIRDEELQIAQTAINLLTRIDPAAPEAVALFFAGLRDGLNQQQKNQWIYQILGPDMIPLLAAGLGDDNPEIRVETARSLSYQAQNLAQLRRFERSQASPSIAGRANALARRRRFGRNQGSLSIASQAADRERRDRLTSQAVRIFIAALKDPDVRVRWIATFALGELESEAETVVPKLIEMAKNATELVPVGDLIQFRPFADRGQYYFLGPSRKGGDPLRIAALQALGAFGRAAAPAVPALVDALRDPDLRIRWFAIETLALIGPEAKAAVPKLIEALRSKDVAEAGMLRGLGTFMFRQMDDGPIRLIAAEALGRIGPEAKAAVPDLIAALDGPDSRVRCEAVRALGAIGPDSAPAIPNLVRQLVRGQPELAAEWSKDALVGIGVAAVPPLLEVLRNDDPDVRVVAIETLGKFGAKAVPAHSNLIAALNDPVPKVRMSAAQCLAEIEPEDAAVSAALVASIKDPDDDVSRAACESLVRIGKPALPPVLALARDDDPDVRKQAVALLSRMATPMPVPVIGQSMDQARDRCEAVRERLRSSLGDPDDRIRSACSEALKEVGEAAVPDLIAVLDDASPAIRASAARILGALGDSARKGLDSLRRHRTDPDPEVGHAVETAIRAIEESEHFEARTISSDP